MLRIVFVVLIVLAVWVLVMKLYNAVKGANVDWTGVSFVVGFIVLAFWLRHVTGIG